VGPDGRPSGRRLRRIVTAPWRFARRNHNLLLLLAGFGTVVGLAVVTGHWAFYRTAYVLGGLAGIALLWARLSLRNLEVTIERSDSVLQVGQRAEARVRLQARGFYTRLWLEVEDATDMPGLPARTVVTLPANGARNWKVSVVCTRRGAFSVGPITVTSGDPFGLFRRRRTFGASQPLLVLPLPEELPHFSAPPAQLPGEGTVRRRTHYVTPNVVGIRDYQPGDSYNRIHWPATARHNRLMVKTFEMDPTSDIWLLLDLQGAVRAGEGDDSTEEYGVRVAASLANRFLRDNRMLGLLAYGGESVALEPARGPRHHKRVLEALALAEAKGDVPLCDVLTEDERRFGRNSTLIIITPSASEDWVEALEALVQRGARAAVVLMEPASFGGSESALMPFSTLVAADILTYLLRRGDDLSIALGPAGTLGERDSAAQRMGARRS
jgi:uncharacterized protein (DUF58 family)